VGRLAACIADRRQSGKIEHTIHELSSQRHEVGQ
jgi:hypothetical protein